jgi:hypothetical protein
VAEGSTCKGLWMEREPLELVDGGRGPLVVGATTCVSTVDRT